jgi:transcriptional regulator with XRE-family HTH domain
MPLEFYGKIRQYPIIHGNSDTSRMITAGQLRAARAFLGIDQRKLAELCGLSLPTIQRMEASDGVVRGNVDSLMKLVGALDTAGIELINEGAVSTAGGRGVRLRATGTAAA